MGITGISDQAAISVVDGQYAVSTDGGLAWGAYTTAPGFVSPNNLVRARHTAAAQAGQATKTTVTVGGISGTFMSVVAGNLACSFDFNGDGVVDATDALLFNRWLLGFRGNALVDGIPAFPATSSKASFMVALRERLVIGAAHDLDGDGFVRAATDGLLLYRLVQSPTGSPVANNALGANPLRGTMNAIKTYAVTGCGANFQ